MTTPATPQATPQSGLSEFRDFLRAQNDQRRQNQGFSRFMDDPTYFDKGPGPTERIMPTAVGAKMDAAVNAALQKQDQQQNQISPQGRAQAIAEINAKYGTPGTAIAFDKTGAGKDGGQLMDANGQPTTDASKAVGVQGAPKIAFGTPEQHADWVKQFPALANKDSALNQSFRGAIASGYIASPADAAGWLQTVNKDINGRLNSKPEASLVAGMDIHPTGGISVGAPTAAAAPASAPIAAPAAAPGVLAQQVSESFPQISDQMPEPSVTNPDLGALPDLPKPKDDFLGTYTKTEWGPGGVGLGLRANYPQGTQVGSTSEYHLEHAGMNDPTLVERSGPAYAPGHAHIPAPEGSMAPGWSMFQGGSSRPPAAMVNFTPSNSLSADATTLPKEPFTLGTLSDLNGKIKQLGTTKMANILAAQLLARQQ